MGDEISDAISTNAQGPSRAASDAQSVEQHSLPDQIEAAKYLTGNDGAAIKKTRGIRFNLMTYPGATGND